MSDDIDLRVVPVPDTKLEDLYSRVVPLQAQQAMVWRRAAKRRGWLVGGLLVASLGQAVAITAILPAERFIPVFVYLNKFGVPDTATALSELPADQRVAGIDGLLWQYVRNREHYAPSEAEESYKIVSAMSSNTVKEQYQKWANPKLNHDSPASKLGQNGFIRVYRVGGAWIKHDDDYTKGVYQVRFCRLVAPEGQVATAQRMNVTVSYQLVSTIPLWERISFNHAGLIVTEYPYVEQEGKDIRYVQAPGGDNPCGP